MTKTPSEIAKSHNCTLHDDDEDEGRIEMSYTYGDGTDYPLTEETDQQHWDRIVFDPIEAEMKAIGWVVIDGLADGFTDGTNRTSSTVYFARANH